MFVKDKTGVAQTAANTAATVTAALVTAGIIKSASAASKYFDERYGETFDVLGPIVDEDNKAFAAADYTPASASKPASKPAGGGSSTKKAPTGKAGGVTDANAGDLVLNSGKFKGLTIAEVYDLTAEESVERGARDQAGALYLQDFLSTEDNPNTFTRRLAVAFLEQVS